MPNQPWQLYQDDHNYDKQMMKRIQQIKTGALYALS